MRKVLRLIAASLCICILFYLANFGSRIPELKPLLHFPEQSPLPTIFVITPTYSRLVQKAELTRVANTFRQVSALHWIVVEDANEKTALVTNFLEKTDISHTQLCVKTPKGKIRSRGALQRNLALKWLRDTFHPEDAPPGVVYFADDDNTYSLDIFEEMRYTKIMSVWPVAFVGGLRYESPKINAMGKVAGWLVKFDSARPFAIDMAGFAINLRRILERPKAMFHLDAKAGYLEPSLLQDLVTIDELEPKAENCSKIMVWHTKTMTPIISRDTNFTNRSIEV